MVVIGLRATLFNCIFTKDFSCPATIPSDLSDVTGYDASAGSDQNGTVAEKINWLQGKANQSQWTGIKAFGCFYEDGADLGGMPADVRAKIRPIAEMGKPAVAKRLYKNLANFGDIRIEDITSFTSLGIAYNLKIGYKYSLEIYLSVARGIDFTFGQIITFRAKIDDLTVLPLTFPVNGQVNKTLSFIATGAKLEVGLVNRLQTTNYTWTASSGTSNNSSIILTELGPAEVTTEWDAPSA